MDKNLVDPVTNQTIFTFLSEFCVHWPGQTVIEVLFLVIIFVVGVSGNSLVLTAIIRNKKLRTVTTILICNLAITDILFATGIPFIAVTRVTKNWILGDFVCKAFTYTQFVSGVCSILTMVMICIDRFICVCLMNKFKMDTCQLTLTLVAIWVIAASFPIPVAIAQTVKVVRTKDQYFKFCAAEWADDFHAEIYLSFMILFFFFIPLIVISLFYLRIWRVVRKSSAKTAGNNKGRSEKSADKQVRLVKMFLSVVVLFVVMWLPFFILSFLGVHYKQITSTHFTATLILALANTCQNPVLYGYFNYRLREEFREICCVKICRRKSPSSTYTVHGTELGSVGQSQNSSTLG